MRKFERISEKEFLKDVLNGNYEDILLPKRSTKNSAGYDFYSLYDITIKPNEIVKIPTGIKVCMNENEFLGIFIRSSLGFKYNIRMCNQVGIIDTDYYNNKDNEGHIFVCLQNHGDKDLVIRKGDRFVQGIFMPFLITDDDNTTSRRIGGIGSTNKGEDNNE